MRTSADDRRTTKADKITPDLKFKDPFKCVVSGKDNIGMILKKFGIRNSSTITSSTNGELLNTSKEMR